MLPQYQVRIKDWNGSVVAVLAGAGGEDSSLSRIHCERKLNSYGNHAVALKGKDALRIANLLLLDYQIEVWRRPISYPDWVRIYSGFHRTFGWQATNDGQEIYTSYGFGYNEMLTRREIAYDGVTSYTTKSGAAETVLKAYVNENLGPGAAAFRAVTGFSVEADQARGDAWSGTRSRKPLLEVAKEIASVGHLYFDIVSVGPAQFQFRVYHPLLGADKTLGNTGGNAPVIFSLQRNNMLIPITTTNRSSEINYVYVLGDGTEGIKTIVPVLDSVAIADSPWNLREVSRSSDSNPTATSMFNTGERALREGMRRTGLAFNVKQMPDLQVDVHYVLGDIVTGLFHGRVDKLIAGIAYEVTETGDDIAVDVADVNFVGEAETE